MERIAWLVLAVFFSGLLLALVAGGWTGKNGAKQWFRSKFIGKTA